MKNKSPFNIPIKVRYDFFIGEHKAIGRIIQILILLFWVSIAYLIVNQLLIYINQTQTVSSLFKDPGFVGLVGTLAGALIGALIGGFFSVNLQSNQQKASALIAKKNEIYAPLYDDLLHFHNEIANRQYPKYLITEKNDNGELSGVSLSFTEWSRIKADYRFVQTPKWIIQAFNQYLEDLREYLNLYVQVIDSVNSILLEDLKQVNGKDNIRELLMNDEYLIRCVMINNKNGLVNFRSHLIDFAIYADVVDKCQSLDSVNKLRVMYEKTFTSNRLWLLDILARLMGYISRKYENQDDYV
jgi:hypothetical protein